jgi:hypothetical protein
LRGLRNSAFEGLPPEIEQKHSNEVFSPALKLINKALAFSRNNEMATWGFAFFIGIIFYYVYLYAKFFCYVIGFVDYLASLLGLNSNVNNIFFTISINFIIDLIASLVASLICGSLFVYVLQKRRLIYSLGAVVSFFLVYARKWRFWQAPDVGMKISSMMAPFLAALFFVFAVWVFMKLGKRFVKKDT